MPVSSKGTLLAGIGALLGVCSAGCLSSEIRHGPFADTGVTVLHPVAEGETTPDTVAKPAPKDEPFFNGPIVRILRPTTQTQTVTVKDGDSLSSWRPMDRGSVSTTPSEPGAIQQVRNPPIDISVPSPVAPEPRLIPQPTVVPPPAPQPVVLHGEPAPHAVGPYYYPSRAVGALPVPREFDKQAMPPYIIEPPDILLIRASRAITLPTQPIEGQHLVKMDGTVNLGIYGEVFVAGRTLEQAKTEIARLLLERRVKGKEPKDLTNPTAKDTELTLDDIKRELQVDVLAFNSKFYFIVIDGGGYGQRVFRLPFTGNETVLDAMSQIGGLPEVSSRKNMWVARATPNQGHPTILPIDWRGIVELGYARTNYQVFPNDRIFVKADLLIATTNWIGKVTAPAEKLLGVTLLGSSVVNSIKGVNTTIP